MFAGAGAVVSSHREERSCFVLSGMWNERREDQFIALSPGSHYTEPAGKVHFGGTGPVETVVPTETKFASTKPMILEGQGLPRLGSLAPQEHWAAAVTLILDKKPPNLLGKSSVGCMPPSAGQSSIIAP
jgi:hypothetical protein